MNFHFWLNYLFKTTKHFRVQECVFESSIFSGFLGSWQSIQEFSRTPLLVWLYNHANSGWISHAKHNSNTLESPKPALFHFLFCSSLLVMPSQSQAHSPVTLWWWGREETDRKIECKTAAPWQNIWTLNSELILNLINDYSTL